MFRRQNLCWLTAVLWLGCEGQIDAPLPRVAVPTAHADDEVLRTQDEKLFDLATRYFPGQDPSPGSTRLSRLTRPQLDATTRALLPMQYGASAVAALPRDPLQKNYEYAANLGFTPVNFTPYLKWVEPKVEGVRANPGGVIACAAGNSACLDTEARKFVARAFRGVVTEARLATFAAFYLANTAQLGVADATADLVDVTLHSPGYVFREEIQVDAAGLLAPAQQLQNLTYVLADAPPEALAMSSATPQLYLQTPEELAKTVDRILATPEARAKLLGFFVAWLEIKAADELTLSPSTYPSFTPAVAAAALEETQRFLEFYLGKPSPKLKDLTQSTQSFVSQPLAAIYQLTQTPLNGATLIDLDPATRLGLFTQPAVIASHSGPTSTRLVKRGVFFTRKVMCLPLGAVPSDVNTMLPVTNGQTERERIEPPTQAAKCAGCHSFINPFGFVQENYDADGKWRTTDNGVAINAAISVSFLDEGKLETQSPVTALKAFTSSARFKQCFVRQLFRFYMGRDEEPGDDPLLRKMFFGFARNDEQDLIGLLRMLATSSHFSQRVAR